MHFKGQTLNKHYRQDVLGTDLERRFKATCLNLNVHHTNIYLTHF